ncbi:MAG: chemotaxis protein CheW [Ignavibacteria bacterium]
MEKEKHIALKNKLNDAIEKNKADGVLSRDEEQKILRKRAELLAQKAVPKAEDNSLEMLFFQIAGEVYGFETKYVKEVCNLKDITPLPLAPDYLKGVINVRGEIIPVIDIKALFELPLSGITDLNKVILLYYKEMIFGVLADRILEIINIPLKSIHSTISTLKGIREEYLIGVTRERAIVLDARKLLTDKKLIINDHD